MRSFAILILVAAPLLPGCAGEDEPVVGEVDIPTNKQFVVYDFWAPWCGPCRAYAPKFEKLREKYNRSNVIFKRINVDEDRETTEQFHIGPIPTVVVTVDGKEVVRFEGGARESQLVKVFK